MEKNTSRLTLGILAHVDSGKTTLSESILFEAGITRRQGRVDKGDAFLDNHIIEKNRGITIFSKEACFTRGGKEFYLIDTPGHIDFSGEMERCLKVLDLAVLIISASEGINGRTENIWKLLARYQIPTFIFVNKTDLPAFDKEVLKKEISERLTPLIFDVAGSSEDSSFENIALGSEEAMEEFLGTDKLSIDTLKGLTDKRLAFPLYFGSALNDEGVKELMDGLADLSSSRTYGDSLSAICYKITRDEKGNRLSHLKITGGVLHLKDSVEGAKVNDIRVYQGDSYTSVPQAEGGMICSVTGLDFTYPGAVIGGREDYSDEEASAIFYELKPAAGVSRAQLITALSQLKEEMASMEYIADKDKDEILVGLMGTVQKEAFVEIMKLRYGIDVTVGQPVVRYFETIKEQVTETVYPSKPEILPNLALTLKPADYGDVTVEGACREEQVDSVRQEELVTELGRRIETRDIAGILTGSQLTGIEVMLSSGRGSVRHLKNGDLQAAITEAFYRGLSNGRSVLLEPYYRFTLDVNQDYSSKIMALIQELGGKIENTELHGNTVTYAGSIPVIEALDLNSRVQTAAKGECSVLLSQEGHRPCHNQKEVIEKFGYHVEIPEEPEIMQSQEDRPAAAGNDELKAIFKMTYGSKGKRPGRGPKVITGENFSPKDFKYKGNNKGLNNTGKPYLIVDGYNIIYAWSELKEIAADNLGGARDRLVEIMSEYSSFTGIEVMIVFDGYKTDRRRKTEEKIHGVTVVYTSEGEIADHYIEKMVLKHADDLRITVATSDRMEQMMVFSQGAQRLSARDLHARVRRVREEINKLL